MLSGSVSGQSVGVCRDRTDGECVRSALIVATAAGAPVSALEGDQHFERDNETPVQVKAVAEVNYFLMDVKQVNCRFGSG